MVTLPKIVFLQKCFGLSKLMAEEMLEILRARALHGERFHPFNRKTEALSTASMPFEDAAVKRIGNVAPTFHILHGDFRRGTVFGRVARRPVGRLAGPVRE
ncbi:MAG: hypothetical protein H0T75_23830 [Rhizobiales bacterium]|nr:hypothetical protein [Hyphomicrobiales bacterium]